MANLTKPKPLPPVEACEELLRVVRASSEPQTAPILAKLLSAPFKIPPKQAAVILEEYVAAGTLHRTPPATAKGKPRFWDRDLATICRDAVVRALRDADGPLTAKDLAAKLPAPPKFSEADVAPFLRQLADAGDCHVFSGTTAKSKPRYSDRGPEEVGRGELLRFLSNKGPQKRSQIRKGVKSLNDSQFEQVWESLRSGGSLFTHPPLGKTGEPLYANRPASPLPYLKDVQKSLTLAVTKLKGSNISNDDLRRAVVQVAEEAGIRFGGGSAADAALSRPVDRHSVDLVALMRQIEPGAERGALVGTAALRRVAQLSKNDFDQAALALSRAGRLSLHRHDYVSSLSAEQRDELVSDGAGNYFVGMALRQSDG